MVDYLTTLTDEELTDILGAFLMLGMSNLTNDEAAEVLQEELRSLMKAKGIDSSLMELPKHPAGLGAIILEEYLRRGIEPDSVF